MTTSDNDKAYLLDVIAELVAKDDFDGARRLIDSLDESPYTVKEVEQAINADFARSDFFDNPTRYKLTLRGRAVDVMQVRDEDTPAGSGFYDTVRVVFSLDNGQHFRKTGYDSSYSGTDWDGSLTEVQPVTKTITTFAEVRR